MSDHWSWAWYRGRVKYELRYLPWWVRRVVRGESRWYAPIRGLWHSLVLMYECEICAVCGHPVAAVWHAEDDLWLKVNGKYAGTTCASCFNRKALAAGASPYWEVHDGEYPTCTGSPCVHVKPMRIQAESAHEYWEALVSATGSREAAMKLVGERMSQPENKSKYTDAVHDPDILEYLEDLVYADREREALDG